MSTTETNEMSTTEASEIKTIDAFDITALGEQATPGFEGSGFADEIRGTTLPEAVRDVVCDYETFVGDRDRFVWKWIHSLFPAFELSSVAPGLRRTARVQKTLVTVFVTVLDDLAESRGDMETFEEARHIPFAPQRVEFGRPGVDDGVLEFLDDLWQQIEACLVESPRYEEFTDLFRYDLRQTLNAIEYGALVNANLELSNTSGFESYTPHNMCMFPYANIDLMHSPSFSKEDLGVVRETLWDVQGMARIGNDLTTWVRELGEEDYSAGVLTHALQVGVVTADELETEDEATIAARIREHCVEERFVNDWWDRYDAVRERAPKADSVDLAELVDGMHTVMEYHLASQGFK